MTRDELITKIDRSWAEWTAALDGITQETASEPGACGEFSIKDLVGHIAFWDEQDLARAQKLARGEVVQPNDWATMNDQEYAEHKDDSFAAQTARMQEAHARLVDALEGFPNIDDLKLEETWEHYDEHSKEVLAWRASKGV